jgi:hypothetical protein
LNFMVLPLGCVASPAAPWRARPSMHSPARRP